MWRAMWFSGLDIVPLVLALILIGGRHVSRHLALVPFVFTSCFYSCKLASTALN